MQYKVVTLSYWESFYKELEALGWEVYGYSSYYKTDKGWIPEKVELRRK